MPYGMHFRRKCGIQAEIMQYKNAKKEARISLKFKCNN